MKLPIIADNFGDVLVFESVEKAETYMEPVDIRNGEYVIYDAEGYLLKPSIVKVSKWRERVVLSRDKDNQHDGLRLKNTLIQFLSQVAVADQPLEQLTLNQLVAMIERFKTE